MTTTLSPTPKQKFFDNNGVPLNKGQLFVYQAGTTTKATTWTDSSGGTTNTNPIILDYRGECNLWVSPNVSYKYVLASATDTDPPTSPIWSVDNIVNSQLITLYGGVDTGIANAYILNFTANFTSLTDGIVIYWIPSHDNTGPSTINVNGLGVVNITYQDGTSLTGSSILANQVNTIMYKGGSFFLLSLSSVFLSGSFTATYQGFSVNPSTSVTYNRVGSLVALVFPNSAGTSNATNFNISGGIPTNIIPTRQQVVPIAPLVDNGVALATCQCRINTDGTINFYPPQGIGVSWTNSGSKGFNGLATVFYTLT